MKNWFKLFSPIVFCCLIIGFYYGSWPFSEWVNNSGVIAREARGLKGIVFMVFAHGNAEHLWANVPSFLLLMYIALFYFPRIFGKVLVFTWLLTGIFIWLFCRGEVMHVGASGLIYALFAFLFTSGIIAKNARLRTVTLLTGITFAGMFWGVLPIQKGVSWDGHLSGLIAGIVAALVFRNEVANHYPIELKDWQKEQDELAEDEYTFIDYRK